MVQYFIEVLVVIGVGLALLFFMCMFVMGVSTIFLGGCW